MRSIEWLEGTGISPLFNNRLICSRSEEAEMINWTQRSFCAASKNEISFTTFQTWPSLTLESVKKRKMEDDFLYFSSFISGQLIKFSSGSTEKKVKIFQQLLHEL
jgi:hypothetical protein